MWRFHSKSSELVRPSVARIARAVDARAFHFRQHSFFRLFYLSNNRKKAGLNMDGQFLIRQIYDDEITYNLITAAVEILSELNCVYNFSAVCHIRLNATSSLAPYVWQPKHTYSLYIYIYTCTICHSAYLFIRDDLISLKLYTEIPADDILELFGKTFFDFCQDSGYDKILQVLGATPRDFLQVCVCVLCCVLEFSVLPISYACH